MSKTQKDRNRIALTQKAEVDYLKAIAREVYLKTNNRKGKFWIKRKGTDKFHITPISVVKTHRISKAVLKGLMYDRIDPSKLDFRLSKPFEVIITFTLIVLVIGILIGHFVIPWIGGLI